MHCHPTRHKICAAAVEDQVAEPAAPNAEVAQGVHGQADGVAQEQVVAGGFGI